MMRSYIKFADRLSVSMGKAFSWCIVILMGGTCYEVFMAYALNAPTLWNFDFSLQMYGAIFMMAGAYTLCTEAHVRGDVIYRLFSQRTQAWIDVVLYFIFFFPGVIALAFYGYEYAALAWKIKVTLQGIGEVFRCIICIQTGSWPERGTERDAEETEKVLMRTSQQGNKEDVI